MDRAEEIRKAIQRNVSGGTVLQTPSGRDFEVETVKPNQIILRVGSGSRIYLNLACIEELVDRFNQLPAGHWMRIGAIKGKPFPGTLDYIVQKHTGGAMGASYFAPLLEYLKVAEINRRRPARIRLII